MRILLIILSLSLVLLMSSCATTLLEKGYDTAVTAEVTYNASRQILKDMDKRGQLTEAQKQEVMKIASDYYEGVIILKKALISYKKAQMLQDEKLISDAEAVLTGALDFMVSAENNLLKVME